MTTWEKRHRYCRIQKGEILVRRQCIIYIIHCTNMSIAYLISRLSKQTPQVFERHSSAPKFYNRQKNIVLSAVKTVLSQLFKKISFQFVWWQLQWNLFLPKQLNLQSLICIFEMLFHSVIPPWMVLDAACGDGTRTENYRWKIRRKFRIKLINKATE